MANFGEFVLENLEERDWSQADLARAAGVSRAAISDVITGRRGPGTELCNAIAHAFELPPETVYRAAGLLPDLPSPRDAAEEILGYKLQELSDRQIDELLKYIEFIQDRDSTLPTTTTPKQKREGSPQAAPSRNR